MADYAVLRHMSSGDAPDESAWELRARGTDSLDSFVGNYEDASKWARRRWHELGRTGHVYGTAEGIDR